MLEKNYCYECGEELKDGDTMYDIGNGKMICEDCRYDYYIECEDCGQLSHRDDALTVDNDALVCDHCAEDYYTCDHCGRLYDRPYIVIDNLNTTLCEYCYNDYYFTCDNCGDVYHRDGLCIIDGNYYCEACANDIEDDVIHHYQYQPELYFYGSDSDVDGYYGLEIEIDNGNNRLDAACDINTAGNGYIYIKEDGSLSYDGMEIVTHPATLDYHMYNFPWAAICETALNYGYRSHDTDTCGLHIHASRSMFGGTTIEQDLTVAKIMLLVDRWYDTYIVQFARRDPSKMRQWADKPEVDIQPGDNDGDAVHKSKKNKGDRYRAINLCNYSTVEFRFFRGTLKRDTVIASIQWVDTIINYCKITPLKDLFNATWDDIFTTTEHAELNSYLKQRNLYNIKKDVI